MFYAGVDGGGTHSRMLVEDQNGRMYGPYSGGSTNMSTVSSKTVAANLRELLGQFFREQGVGMDDLSALCVGSAGIDIPEDAVRMKAVLESIGLRCPMRVINDVEIVLESEIPGEPGVVIISGTGSVALGRDAKGNTHRTGGWGHLVGDEGSGYWMANKAISYCLKSYDGRRAPSALEAMLCEHFHADSIPGMIQEVYYMEGNKARIANAAKWVDAAVERGDQAAIHILDRSAKALYELAEAAFHKLDLPKDTAIVLSGGVLHGSEPLRKMLEQRLQPLSANIRLTTQNPCAGAIYMAKALADE